MLPSTIESSNKKKVIPIITIVDEHQGGITGEIPSYKTVHF